MDNPTQNQIPEYVTKLPQAVQDFVYAGAWEVRTNEIARKYSLGPEQTDALANIVVLVLIGLESPDTFLDTIVVDLGISRLLAEQIMSDLEKRVFEYAIQKVGGYKELTSKENVPQVPEIKPNNLPMVEKGEVAHDNIKNNQQNNIVAKPVSKPIPQQPTGPLVLNPIGEAKRPATPEPIQRPVPVPRFVPPITESPSIHQGRPIQNNQTQPTPTPKAPPTPVNIIDNKLNTVVKSVSSQVPKPPTEKPPQKYTTDPYREPLN